MSAVSSAEFFLTGFRVRKAMAILRGFNPQRSLELTKLAWSAQLDLVEIPLQNDDSARALAACAAAASEEGKIVGAGTIVSKELVERAAELGAKFTVAPGFNLEVARHSEAHGMPHLPGVATATEVQDAMQAGFMWLKAFPAAQLGPEWITAMHGPFPEARFVATGGINSENATHFLTAGASGVSFGASFTELTTEEINRLK